MNPYLAVILAILVGRYLLDLVSDLLNVGHFSPQLPAEFDGFYDADRYARSQRYLADNVRFGLFQDAIFTTLTVVFIATGGFNLVDRLARSAGFPESWTGLLFAAILVFVLRILGIPFALYSTFKIEEKYGFNKTTPRTFTTDFLKELLLTAVIGGPVFLAVVWFFGRTDTMAWIYCWGAVVTFQVFLLFIAPYVIMPLFNKFTPLEEGELRTAIAGYAQSRDFRMQGIFKMDGSKRSSKSNAFFTGFGRTRRLVLLDTLIEKHTVPELLAVVAHEMGHYKKKHVPWAIVRAAASAGIAFFLLSLFIRNERLFEAFRMEHVSVYASLIFFGFLYTPIAMVLAIVENRISQSQEFAADAYAAQTTSDPEAMITALKKLGVDNLANLTPHPFKVFLSYSHPPLLARIAALRRRSDQ